MTDQIGFYGKLPPLPSAEEMEADYRERVARDKRKEREARERAIQAGVDAVGLLTYLDDRDMEFAKASAEAAIKSILESMGDYSWY